MTAEDFAQYKAEIDSRIEMLENTVVELRAELAATNPTNSLDVLQETPEKPTLPTLPFIFEKTKYKFNFAAIWHNGVRILAQDALEDVELQRVFVKEYPNSVTKIS